MTTHHRLGLLLLLLLPSGIFADALERLNFFFQVTTFKAKFTQEVYDDEKKLLETSQGNVLFHRPGQFRWEYHTPDTYIITTDGLNLLVYDPSLSQAYVRPTMEAIGTAPLRLLLDRRKAIDDFYIDTISQGDALEWIRLSPKVDDTEFTHFEVGFSKHGIRKMLLFDRFDQRIEIHFNNVQTNIPIAAHQFKLRLPQGTDIIGDYLR